MLEFSDLELSRLNVLAKNHPEVKKALDVINALLQTFENATAFLDETNESTLQEANARDHEVHPALTLFQEANPDNFI